MAIEGVTTCLWFDDQAQEAAQFYVATFPGSKERVFDAAVRDGATGAAGIAIAGFLAAGLRAAFFFAAGFLAAFLAAGFLVAFLVAMFVSSSSLAG